MILEVFDIDSKYYKEMIELIIESKVNPPEKGNIHHIIPKCWFKHYNLEVDDSISNTVLLTYENHKKVHTLAYKCAKEIWLKTKLSFAAHLMGDKEAKYKFSEETKKKWSESRKGRIPWNKGKKWSNPNGSIALKGKKKPKRTEEHSKHISESKKGKKPIYTEDGLRRKREATIKYNKTRNYRPSEETKKKISIAQKGKKKPRKVIKEY